MTREAVEALAPGVWRYHALLPIVAADAIVSLGEGGTPLVHARRLGTELGLNNLLLKDESRNPTGSFIDRGSTVLVSLAKEKGVRTCSCVTTGNLGASLAAYCAKGGLHAEIRIKPDADRGKLYQMIAYGAQVETFTRVSGSAAADRHSLQVNAGNPYILEGEKTTGFEMVEDMGWKTPDVIMVPVGTGGHLSMIWRALSQMRESGLVEKSGCRLLGVQFRGSASLVERPGSGGRGGRTEEPFTELEGSEPIFRKEAVKAIEESRGVAVETSIRETIGATSLLARTEGIFAEPAAASVVASLEEAKRRRLIDRDETVVCVITGAGLKDTKAIARIAKATRQAVAGEDYAVARTQIGGTKVELLRSIAEAPSFGYKLWKSLSARRKITTASVYQHLEELEGIKFVRRARVATVSGRERVFYELTKEGLDFLQVTGRIEKSRRP